jgi:adenine-specific DNA-methyltransferase
MAKLLPALEAEDATFERSETRKRHGIHYTPPNLAKFVARRALPQLAKREAPLVLDPACGDGELLLAVAVEAAAAGLPAPHLVGIDRDEEAIGTARRRLADAPAASVALRCEDFLEIATEGAGLPPREFDLVVSNPPYVRTQVLGAARAQALTRRFDLTGRIDLYHAFAVAMTAELGKNGVLALLCSNRFISTKGGNSLRSLLEQRYEIAELWDLGDSKLFSAAVLPALLVARHTKGGDGGDGAYVRVYEDAAGAEVAPEAASLLDALEGGTQGPVQVGKRRFVIERGGLLKPKSGRPWRLASPGTSRWLDTVRKHSAGRFGDLGPIRVGIKTTADKVFIRTSWDELPHEMRPEDTLLRPLLTHRVASRWRAREDARSARTVLYTHQVAEGKRRAISLEDYPRAAAYLERHRDQLEARAYVRRAGRAWYEIWVPQQPDAWAAPKLVWPDISEEPRFFLDDSGSIVNGDCYWLSCGEVSPRELSLAVAVANSSFAVQHYDLCCGNRLYAGRRRFITQYVEELPLPPASSADLDDIAAMVGQLQAEDVCAETKATLESTLDAAIRELFGLKEPSGQA